MRKAIILLPLFLFILVQCKPDDKTPLLIGEWQGISWKVDGTESGRDFNAVRFEFRADNSYDASYGNESEKGSFRLKNNHLYTTAENNIEKMVKLSTLTADTIVMDMNRVGVSEALVLVKKR